MPPENTQLAFKELMRNILIEHVPTEQLDFFDFEADNRIDELFNPQPAPVVTGHIKAYGAAFPSELLAEIKPPLEYIGLVLSTFKALRETYAWWKGKHETEVALSAHLRTNWLADLQNVGVTDDQANQIVDSFLSNATALAKDFKTEK